MKRQSDFHSERSRHREFQLTEHEIDHYSADPSAPTSNKQNIKYSILLGLSTAIGVAAVLLAGPTHTPQTGPTETAPHLLANSTHHKNTFETAKAFGWQAALKGQNPPHNVEHWRETAALWQQAINLLSQVARYDKSYTIAQTKKAEYQGYLQQIKNRQTAAQNLTASTTPAPQFSRAVSQAAGAQEKASALPPLVEVAQTSKIAPSQRQTGKDFIAIAKDYGWQAALASQNAPHPTEKWADISRLWQLALHNLDKIETQHPSYAEAQQIKTQYQQNLAAIRQRYQREQSAHQRVQSLQAALTELEGWQTNANASETKRSQMQAIVSRLSTIPASTVAYRQAQQLIAITNEQIQTLPATAQIAISTEDDN